LIRTRGNAALAQFAEVPILAVGHVAEFNGVVRMKLGAAEAICLKETTRDKRQTRL